MTAVTCVALARLKASIQKSSSMKLSLTGYSVPCTMKHVAAADVLQHADEDVALAEDVRLGPGQLDAAVAADDRGRVPGWPSRRRSSARRRGRAASSEQIRDLSMPGPRVLEPIDEAGGTRVAAGRDVGPPVPSPGALLPSS